MPPSGGPQLHLVSGGGGAFMHATHPYANADFDSRARNNPTSSFYAVPQESFPTRNQSVRHFAGLLVPGVVRMMGHLLLFLAGVLTGGIAGWFWTPGPACSYARVASLSPSRCCWPCWCCCARPDASATRSSALARRVVSVGAFAVGAARRLRGLPARPGATSRPTSWSGWP